MRVTLAYGREGLALDVPDGAEVVVPEEPVPVADEAAAVREALTSPLSGPGLAGLVRAGSA